MPKNGLRHCEHSLRCCDSDQEYEDSDDSHPRTAREHSQCAPGVLANRPIVCRAGQRSALATTFPPGPTDPAAPAGTPDDLLYRICACQPATGSVEEAVPANPFDDRHFARSGDGTVASFMGL